MFQSQLTDEQYLERNVKGRLPFCDCDENHKLHGTQLRKGRANTFIVTEIDKDELCVHCGHMVVWERADRGSFKGVSLGLYKNIYNKVCKSNKRYLEFPPRVNGTDPTRLIKPGIGLKWIRKINPWLYELTDEGYKAMKEANFL